MDLVNISRFLAVMDAESFAAAAKICNLTPQAIAFSVGKLETELGVKLFDREPGGTTRPTEYAGLLEVHARGLIIAEQRAVEAVKALRDARSGWIRLGIGETMTGSVIAGVIAGIKRERPDVDVALIEDYTDRLIQRLNAGEIDMIAGAPVGGMQGAEHLIQHMLFESTDAIVARRQHPLALRRGVTLADMREYTWLVPYARRDTHEAVMATYVRAGLAPPGSFIFSDTATVGLALVRAQDYLLMVPPDMIPFGEASELVRIDADLPAVQRTACLIYRADTTLSEIMSLVRDRILQAPYAGRTQPAPRPTAAARRTTSLRTAR